MDPNYVGGMHSLLQQLTGSDTTLLKSATAKLNTDYYKSPSCIPALASILASSPDFPVRQLAAVELRKRVSQKSGDLWTQVSQSERDQIKAKLPELALAEPNSPVRNATARVIAAIASIELPLGTYADLLPFLNTTSLSANVVHREVAVFILYAVLENVVEGFQEQLPELFQLFERTLQDPESVEVRITSVRALGTLAQYIDSDERAVLKSFQALLPGMIQVLGQSVETGNETGARQLFDVFETLLILEVPVISHAIPQFAEFLLTCGGNASVDAEIRVLALNALTWTVQYKKSKIQSNNLAPAILQGLMPIAAEDEPEDVDDDCPSRSALRIIDSLATSLPPTQVFPALRELIQQYFSSPNPAFRRAAMLALGVAVEGCSEYMRPLMAGVWPVIEAGLQDGDASVRKATCIAVSCLCEWLEDDCVKKHAVLMPAIMNLINDPETQRTACTALDAMLEVLHDVIEQYLSLIMERLTGLLESAPIAVKAVVTGAMGSAAHASGDKFLPYFQPTMDRLQHFLVLTGPDETELRGITMDAIGTFAEAVGKEVFRPYFADMMTQAFSGIETGVARLRECSFLFFGVMARVFGEEFAVYLPSVVPPLLESCKQIEKGEEGLTFEVADPTQAFATGSSASNAIAINDENVDANGNISIDVEELDIDAEGLMDANSAMAVEKEIAADTLGSLFEATRAHFFPYVEPATLELVNMLPHYYEGIRKSATDALLAIVRTFYELSSPEEWSAGIANAVPLNDTVKKLVEHAIVPLLEMYETEDDRTVVSALCVGLAETITTIGPAFLEGHLEEISAIAVEVLEQKAHCQQDPDQDDEEEAPEDQAEYDSVLISSAGDLVAAMATALGPDFALAFGTFFPLISKFYKQSRSLGDRSSAIGTLGEIIAGMKSAVTPSTQPLLELFYRALSDESPEVRSNAAFASGLLVEHTEVDLSAQYGHLLTALQPLFVLAADPIAADGNARDNAAGAVARLIVRNTAAVPLQQVLPIFIGALPLKYDPLENRAVYDAIFHLFRTNAPVLLPFFDQLLAAFAAVLATPSSIPEASRAQLVELVRVLNGEDSAKVQNAGLTQYL